MNQSQPNWKTFYILSSLEIFEAFILTKALLQRDLPRVAKGKGNLFRTEAVDQEFLRKDAKASLLFFTDKG